MSPGARGTGPRQPSGVTEGEVALAPEPVNPPRPGPLARAMSRQDDEHRRASPAEVAPQTPPPRLAIPAGGSPSSAHSSPFLAPVPLPCVGEGTPVAFWGWPVAPEEEAACPGVLGARFHGGSHLEGPRGASPVPSSSSRHATPHQGQATPEVPLKLLRQADGSLAFTVWNW